MIAYFDTSAIVPLLIQEDGSSAARAAWDGATRASSATIAYAEARAAIAQARRLRRIDPTQARIAVGRLEDIYLQLDVVAVDEALIREAGALADEHNLRGYDAVHLAAACNVADQDLVVVAGDRALLDAAQAVGLAIAPIG